MYFINIVLVNAPAVPNAVDIEIKITSIVIPDKYCLYNTNIDKYVKGIVINVTIIINGILMLNVILNILFFFSSFAFDIQDKITLDIGFVNNDVIFDTEFTA